MFLGALLLAATTPQVSADLIGFYSFDDPGDPLIDDSGNGLNLVSSGEAGADPQYTETEGFDGSGAYLFNGGQRWLTPFDIDASIYPQLTMGAWVKTSSLDSGLRKIIGHDDGGWDRVIGLDNRPLTFGYATFTGTGVLNTEDPPVSTDHWTFIAATYDQDTAEIALYVDLDVSVAGPIPVRTTTGTFGFGHIDAAIGGVRPDNASEGWLGTIDNVFFYDEVLSHARLTTIRDHGKDAILGLATGDDPNIVLLGTPDLSALAKSPQIQTLDFTLSNSGTFFDLNISDVTVTGPDAAHFTVFNFPASIPPGGMGIVELEFDNADQVGTFQVQMTIESDDPGSPSFVVDIIANVGAPTLLGFYSFDDPDAPLADDSGRNRTLTGPAAPAFPTYMPGGGIEGGAFSFDGAQRLAAPINISPATVPTLTMGAWVQTAELEGFRKVMGHDDGGWDRTIGLDGRGAGVFTHYTAFTGGDRYPVTEPLASPIDPTAWTFIAAVYEQARNIVTLYVDLDASTTGDDPQSATAVTTLGPGAASVGIGSLSPTANAENWVGLIDNVFLINGAMDADMIRNLRDMGKAAALELLPDPIISVPSGPVFGSLPDSSPLSVDVPIGNLGDSQTLSISDVRLSGPNADLYSLGGPPPVEVAPGGEVLIPVTLTPGSAEGLLQATLEILSNNSANRSTLIDLSAYLPFENALLGFYSFDDAGNPLNDDSGQGAHLTTVTGAEPIYLATEGFEGGAYQFDGAQWLTGPIDIGPGTLPQLTMGAWVKTATLEAGMRKIMGHDNGGWDRAIGLDERGGAFHYTAFTGGDRFPLTEPPSTPVSTEAWSFVAATFDELADMVTFYVDLDASSTADPVALAEALTTHGSGAAEFAIGSLSPAGGENWNGLIDNVFLFRNALSSSQITAIRDGGAAAILGTPQPDLAITSVLTGDSEISIVWSSSPAATYGVDYKASLDEADWTRIATLPADGETTQFTDTDAGRLAQPLGFYRIAQEP